MKSVYIAGPVSSVGPPTFNYPAFRDAAHEWNEHGWLVTNPAAIFAGDTNLPYDQYLRRGIEQLMDCDAIAVLPGWEQSQGACLEVVCAIACGMPVYDATQPLPAYHVGSAAPLLPPPQFAEYLSENMERINWLPNQLAIGYATQESPESILSEAERLVAGDRLRAYSHPAHNFATTAELWTAYLKRRRSADGSSGVEPHDVALMMVLFKIGREGYKHKRDNLVDGAGYLRCAQMVHDYNWAWGHSAGDAGIE